MKRPEDREIKVSTETEPGGNEGYVRPAMTENAPLKAAQTVTYFRIGPF